MKSNNSVLSYRYIERSNKGHISVYATEVVMFKLPSESVVSIGGDL